MIQKRDMTGNQYMAFMSSIVGNLLIWLSLEKTRSENQ